ncbi:MAG: 4Fe-4S binding protein [Bacteroidetes bacterium]|nr:4Fe-4S binding protein [Bacteroidota bacterium]
MSSTSVQLEEIAQRYNDHYRAIAGRIIVCAGTGCIANGSRDVYEQFLKELEFRNLKSCVGVELYGEESEFQLSISGCQGFCQMGPLVTILPQNIFYTRVTVDDVAEIVNETILNNRVLERLLYRNPTTRKPCRGIDEIPFYTQQRRVVLQYCGIINPEDIVEYIAIGGYTAARRAFCEMDPDDIISVVEESGLRGRGGGGFPTGKKWRSAALQESVKKYIICNGDEGDPGAFMDRSVMEGNPHSVIEGMMIAARAIGADEGYVYVRAEYPLAVHRIRKAVHDAEELGILGENVFGTQAKFRVTVMEGAGAFVCGEETALIASIEGKRGMPMPKPPFPAEAGLFGKPTVINNVETLASIPWILMHGAEAYRAVGTKNSPGTKTFALSGHVVNTGLIEVPFGTTLREIIFDIGGGITVRGKIGTEKDFKAVQIGGPSGACLSPKYLDFPLDFDSLRSIGAMVGSGGLVVMNHDTCMVQMARYFMQFTQSESCGKCVLCREGTYQMLVLLDNIIEGRSDARTLLLLEQVARAVSKGSLCGLGKSAPNPVLSILRDFRDEFEAHVQEKRCPAKKCKALLNPTIIPEKCRGCGLCVKVCPVGAIKGERKQPHTINEQLCIKCGACLATCKLDAIV